MAHCHYEAAFSCHMLASEILSMFACFGLIFHTWGLLPLEACWTSYNLFLWFYSCMKFILQLKFIDVKFSHDFILIYFVLDHLFLWSLSSLIVLWSQQNGVMTIKIGWWDCPSTRRWSYSWSCVWCFDVAGNKFAIIGKKTTWGVHSPNVAQEREVSHNQIVQDCFAKHSIYNNRFFRCWYQMRHTLFLCIMDNIYAHDNLFHTKVICMRCCWIELHPKMHMCNAHACIWPSYWCLQWILQNWKKHNIWMFVAFCESNWGSLQTNSF